MKATPDNVHTVATGLDHPEGLNFGPDGMLYAGGEQGQLYRIDPSTGAVNHYATAPGFLMLGVTLDGNGNLYGCSVGRQEVVKVTPDGKVSTYSSGIPNRTLANPNYSVFDSSGNLYYSDSGDYFSPTGCIYVVRPNGATELFHPGPLHFPNGLAIAPDEKHLYIAQSISPDIIRIPLEIDVKSEKVEVYLRLNDGTVPDGLAFTADNQLIIACYVPDRILLAGRNGHLSILLDDPWAELLNRPTNVALRDGTLYFANLGGWHIGAVDSDLEPMPLRYPRL